MNENEYEDFNLFLMLFDNLLNISKYFYFHVNNFIVFNGSYDSFKFSQIGGTVRLSLKQFRLIMFDKWRCMHAV